MDTESCDEKVEAVARAMRSYYIQVRQVRYNQPDYWPQPDRGSFKDSPWYKAALLAVKYGFSAAQWVDFAFFVIETNRAIQPNMLHMSRLNEKRIREYRREILVDQVNERVNMMLNLYVSYLKAGLPMVSVLLNTSFYFNPAFRYAMAALSHLQQVMEMFEKPAREFLIKSPQWREHLMPYIPECYHGAI